MGEKSMSEEQPFAECQTIVAHQPIPLPIARSIGHKSARMIERAVAVRSEGFAHVVFERQAPLQFAVHGVAIAQCRAEIGAEKELRTLAKQFLSI